MWTLTEQKDWQFLEKFEWVSDMKNVPQDARHHAEGDVATHTQMVLNELEKLDAYKQLSQQDQHILWVAALLHDVEKRSTTVTEADGTITSKGHAKKGAITSRIILYKDLPAPFAIRELICGLVRFHGLPLWVFEKKDPVKAVIEASLQTNTRLLAILARADVLGRMCADQADMLYRIELFQALCEENECWGTPRHFATPQAKFRYFEKEDGHPDFVPFDEPGSCVVLMAGLPGAGKDTFVKRHYANWPVINLDDIRKEHKIAPTDKSGNGRAVQMAKEMARVYLRQQKNFVWNATNVTRQMRDQLIDLFTTYKATIKIVYVEVGYQKLHAQNTSRETMIPKAAIEKLIAKLEVPMQSEADEVLYQIQDERQIKY